MLEKDIETVSSVMYVSINPVYVVLAWKRIKKVLVEGQKPTTNSAMVPCQLWPNPNGCCPVGRVECYKYSACQVARHQ